MEPGGRASEPDKRGSDPAGRASEPAWRVVEQAGKASESDGGTKIAACPKSQLAGPRGEGNKEKKIRERFCYPKNGKNFPRMGPLCKR